MVVVFRWSTQQVCWLPGVSGYLTREAEFDQQPQRAVDGYKPDVWCNLPDCCMQLGWREVRRGL